MKNRNSCFETILEEKIILIPFCMETIIRPNGKRINVNT